MSEIAASVSFSLAAPPSTRRGAGGHDEMADELDNLTWNGKEWVGAVAIPCFRGVGREFFNPLRDEVLRPWGGYAINAEAAAAEPPEPQSNDPLDVDVLFRDARFLIRFDTGERRRGLPRAQRAAWQQIATRDETVWQDTMAMEQTDYQTQRPVRVKWWKATFGDLPFDRELPQINDLAQLSEHCRPYGIKIHQSVARTADVSMHFMCSWIREGFSVRIRNGKPIAIESTQDSWWPNPERVIQHPTLGSLRMYSNGDVWFGHFRCDPMLEYQRIVEQRAASQQAGLHRDRPRSEMWWNYAHGRFGLYIDVDPPGAEPDPRQFAALQAFSRDESRNLAIILDAVYLRYQQRRQESPRDYFSVEPHLQHPEQLKEMIELINVYVHPPADDGTVRLVFELHCSFQRSMIILWRNGAIERFGKWGDHEPPRK